MEVFLMVIEFIVMNMVIEPCIVGIMEENMLVYSTTM